MCAPDGPQGVQRRGARRRASTLRSQQRGGRRGEPGNSSPCTGGDAREGRGAGRGPGGRGGGGAPSAVAETEAVGFHCGARSDEEEKRWSGHRGRWAAVDGRPRVEAGVTELQTTAGALAHPAGARPVHRRPVSRQELEAAGATQEGGEREGGGPARPPLSAQTRVSPRRRSP